ncbi:MAG: lysozyme [Actinomycetota bacterium]|nr:lysozyme [Actinomycetota bacterium]
MRRFCLILILGTAMLGLPAQADAVTKRTTTFIAKFEGFVPCPYADPAGHATIGYGHLLHYGPPTKADRKKWGCITEAQGMKLLRKDLKSYETAVLDRIAGARVTPNMVTALTSFAFNLGPGALDLNWHKGAKRHTNIAWHVLQGNYRRAGKEILLYDGIIVGGKRVELEGLRIRRRKEFRLMVKDINKLRKCKSACKSSPGTKSSSGGIRPG